MKELLEMIKKVDALQASTNKKFYRTRRIVVNTLEDVQVSDEWISKIRKAKNPCNLYALIELLKKDYWLKSRNLTKENEMLDKMKKDCKKYGVMPYY